MKNKVMLDEFHVGVYIRKGAEITKEERKEIKAFFQALVWMVEVPLSKRLQDKIKMEVTR